MCLQIVRDTVTAMTNTDMLRGTVKVIKRRFPCDDKYFDQTNFTFVCALRCYLDGGKEEEMNVFLDSNRKYLIVKCT